MRERTWKMIYKSPGYGLRFFVQLIDGEREAISRVAVADNSGATPDRTDDGVLWIDLDRPWMVRATSFMIPVKRQQDSAGGNMSERQKPINDAVYHKTAVNGTTILGLRPIDVDDCMCPVKHAPSSLLGHVNFCGAYCHVHMLRVENGKDGVQRPVCDPYDRWAGVCALDEIAYETVEVPGHKGEWVLWLHPGEK